MEKVLYSDVVIIGGGMSGCAAAIVSARRCNKTILLEASHSLGGLATNDLVIGVAGMAEGVCREFLDRMDSFGELIPTPHLPAFDPDKAKIRLEEMIHERGGKILYGATVIDTLVEDKVITGVVAYTKSGKIEIRGKYFIDATGDADVAAQAGVPYEVGSDEFSGLNMSTTMAFRMANVNMEEYQKAEEDWYAEQVRAGVPFDKRTEFYGETMSKAVAAGDLPHYIFPTALVYRVPGTDKKNADICIMTCHSFYTHNTDQEDISRQIIEQHQQILWLEKVYRKYLPGYENARITAIANMHGIRDSRRIQGEYVFKAADVAAGRKFDDGIARFPEMFDTHHPTNAELGFMRHCHLDAPEGTAVTREAECSPLMHPLGRPAGIEARPDPRDYCDIPYRAIVPKGINNLFAVGRCVSAEFGAVGAVRVIAPAMSTGQAAAVAADLCIKKGGIAPKDLDGAEVRKTLIEEEKVPLNELTDGFWQAVRDTKGEPWVNAYDFVELIEEDVETRSDLYD